MGIILCSPEKTSIMKLFTGFTLVVAATSAFKFGGQREQGNKIQKFQAIKDTIQNLSEEERQEKKNKFQAMREKVKDQAGQGKFFEAMKEKLEGLSQEEREAAKAKFMAAKKDRFQAMKEKFMKLPDDDKEELIGTDKLEKLKALKEAMKDMSEEEREAKKSGNSRNNQGQIRLSFRRRKAGEIRAILCRKKGAIPGDEAAARREER